MKPLTDSTPRGKEYVHTLPLYIPGRATSEVALELGMPESQIIKLASNENPLGPSPLAQAAMAALASHPSSCYPDPDARELKLQLQQHFGIATDCITLGSGSSEILEIAARVFAGPGDSVISSEYSFAAYQIAAASVGARAVVIPARNFGHDFDAMLAAVDNTTKLIYIANPNNPTGTFAPQNEIAAFLEQLPTSIAVVLDEAYAEYLPDELQSSPAALIQRHPNLIVARTFSKIYGLAGLRIGYAFAQPALTALLNRVRPVFNTTTFAQAAAIAAIRDTDFVLESRTANDIGKEQLSTGFDQLGLEYVPSFGNFILLKVGDGASVTRALYERGIIIRPMAAYALPEWVRISVGLPERNDVCVAAIAAHA